MNIAVLGWEMNRPLLEAVTAARALKQAEDTLLLCALNFPREALARAARAGVDCLVAVRAQTVRPDMAALAQTLTEELNLQSVVFPAGRSGRWLAAALAGRLNGDCTLECTALGRGRDGALQAVRPVFASNALACFTSLAPFCTLVPRDRAFPPAALTQDPAPVRKLDCAVPPAVCLPETTVPFERDGLDGAELVVVGGRGIENRRDLALVEDFTRALGGAFAATRPLVMSGLVPSFLLVGQSGRSIAPKVCLAVGVSGSTPFLAGIGPKTRLVAVNSNPDANIFSHADFGLVADYRALLPRLLKAWGRGENAQ